MKPGTISFATAGLTALVVLGMLIGAIWTGDGRWGYTALFLGIAALILVIVGSARAAAAEKRREETKSISRLFPPGDTDRLNRACKPAQIFTPGDLPSEK